MSNLTISEVRDRLINKDMLRLLVNDYEECKRIVDNTGYFGKRENERADEITKHIIDRLNVSMYDAVRDVLEEKRSRHGNWR